MDVDTTSQDLLQGFQEELLAQKGLSLQTVTAYTQDIQNFLGFLQQYMALKLDVQY